MYFNVFYENSIKILFCSFTLLFVTIISKHVSMKANSKLVSLLIVITFCVNFQPIIIECQNNKRIKFFLFQRIFTILRIIVDAGHIEGEYNTIKNKNSICVI